MSLSKGTPASSQIIWLEGRVQKLESEIAAMRGLEAGEPTNREKIYGPLLDKLKPKADEAVATIRTWHKNGTQHAELYDWTSGIESMADGKHNLYASAPSGMVAVPISWLGSAKRGHYYCEDGWYSCPKHPDGCTNKFQGSECNCGADEWNAEIDSLLSAAPEVKK